MRSTSRLAWWGLLAMAAFTVQAANPALDEVSGVLPRLQPDARAALERRAAQWAEWNPGQRESFQQRMQAWDDLARGERDAIREGYLAWQALPASERASIAAAASRYQALPAGERLALRDTYEALDGSERRGWMLGPVLGSDYPALQPLLAQVPVEEHAALLTALRAMTAQQRRDLAVLVQRSSPQERERLRSELATLEPGGIAAWLWERLDR
ncbi:DUF3106 domain-containing protein [Novilysobacter avium]|uniref:DUF3106 domain-containing protein n=1 Tax=Novilysobacter avium TaxID=2781023 RepID=A0A7S6ZUK9_9GAMM|nr:DUF3106 domain-containing protein [Lysobacter avium]QOW22233.1 DUF3106 domain-containing protein [Lysobacter avium]